MVKDLEGWHKGDIVCSNNIHLQKIEVYNIQICFWEIIFKLFSSVKLYKYHTAIMTILGFAGFATTIRKNWLWKLKVKEAGKTYHIYAKTTKKIKCHRREMVTAGFFYEQKSQNNKQFWMSKKGSMCIQLIVFQRLSIQQTINISNSKTKNIIILINIVIQNWNISCT